MYLVDTHQHLWDLQRFSYAGVAKIPTLNRSFVLTDYLAAAANLGIAKTVFMECDVDPPYLLDEAREIQSLANRNPLIAGIVAAARPEDEGFAHQLEQLAELPSVRGVRRVLHTQPDDLALQRGFIEHLRLLPGFNFTFDLCLFARQLPTALELVRQCPQVTFILDHCGVPDIKAGAFDPWCEHIRALAAFPNVTCKVSGLVAYADSKTWTAPILRPWVDHVLEHFGWNRVVWGSDWPVCMLSATLAQWVEATRILTHHGSVEDRAKLFHRNAERIYRI